MNKIITGLITLVLLASCQGTGEPIQSDSNNDSVEKTDSTEQMTKVEFPEDPKFNDLSVLLAGIDGSENSLYKAHEDSDEWKKYQSSLKEIWKRTNEKLPVMREWSTKELGEINKDGGTLFYPFSGPDFLHADIFFPEHDNIVMIGLEPIGTFPDINEKMKDSSGQLYFNGVHKSLYALLNLSFFRTIAMADDFKGEVDGTLPVLMHFLVRTNHEVLYQEKVGVLPEGTISTNTDNMSDTTYFGNRFYYREKGSERVKTLTYFAVNLQNTPYGSPGLEIRTDFVAYLKELNIKWTYLKSASYLMHRSSFSIIRNIILNESEYVLQDDSGMPVKYFEDKKWDLTFYGVYQAPISLFKDLGQADLKEIYASEEIEKRDLPFGIGYKHRKGTSNLMLAKKK
jgi:hypothetical protein